MISDKVLFVDDDISTLKAYKRQLRKQFSITTAIGGEEGLAQVVERGPYAVIVSDLCMPFMDGFEFLSRVQEISPDSIRIMLTGNADLNIAIKAVNEGSIFRFLTKPCEPDTLANMLGAGVEHYRLVMVERELNEKVKAMSITDPLTGCYNRGYLIEHLPQEIKRARRYERCLSVVMCDIDHFKKINDGHGHQAGDNVLRMFVQCIAGSIRKDIDWLARYGGEEFVIVLPETNLEGAFTLAERLRRNTARMEIEIDNNEINISASFGIAWFDRDTPDEKVLSDVIIDSADKCLYQAKRLGRNRVIG
ncbi:MAG: diguanylate cyclase [Thermodesulfobacteriota bacterium]|nr:diguanylate cyclase [Thermodesulfobacteriota bacterium]